MWATWFQTRPRRKHGFWRLGIRDCDPPLRTWGRLGFDAGIKVCGACREGSDSRKTIAVTFIVANDENYALAA